MAEMPNGGNRFVIVGRSLIAKPGNGIGLLYYTGEQFDNFTLRLDFCLPHPRDPSGNKNNDNSGIFVRFRDPRKPVLPSTPGPDVPGNDATVAVDTGYEIQIDEEARGDTRKKEPDGSPEQDGHFYNRTGAIYKVKAAGAAPGQQNYTVTQKLAAGLWHSFEIKVTDRTYSVKRTANPPLCLQPIPQIQMKIPRQKASDPDSGLSATGIPARWPSPRFAEVSSRSHKNPKSMRKKKP